MDFALFAGGIYHSIKEVSRIRKACESDAEK